MKKGDGVTAHSPYAELEQPVDVLLAGYAAGMLPAALHALMAAHLELSTRNHAFVAALEAGLGDMIAQEAPLPVVNRDSALAAIFASSPTPPAPPGNDHALLPPSLRRFIGNDAPAEVWREMEPGVTECQVAGFGNDDVRLCRIAAGCELAPHVHAAQEVVLVLQGGFSDVAGRFTRGDVVVIDPATQHGAKAPADCDCLLFCVVTDA